LGRPQAMSLCGSTNSVGSLRRRVYICIA